MTAFALVLCVLCQVVLVAGQLLLKHAMNATHHLPRPWLAIVGNGAAGIGLLSVWFFLWLGLLRDWDLSRLYVFEGLGPPLLVLGAWFFLGERVILRAWIGMGLIGCGVALVSVG